MYGLNDCDRLFMDDRFAESIDLDVQDVVVHKHTPYVVILVKVAEQWTKSHGGSLPSTREEKKEFKVYIFGSLFLCWLLYFVNYFLKLLFRKK
jgi:hypothetical protein